MPDMIRKVNAPAWHFPQRPPILNIGHVGDNEYTEIRFPIGEPIEAGTDIELYVKPDDTDLYQPADIWTEDAHTFVWRIAKADTQRGRAGEFMIWMQRGNQRWVAYHGKYIVHSSIDNT